MIREFFARISNTVSLIFFEGDIQIYTGINAATDTNMQRRRKPTTFATFIYTRFGEIKAQNLIIEGEREKIVNAGN